MIIGVTLKDTSDTTQVANEAVLFAPRDDQSNQYRITALLDDHVHFGSVVTGRQSRRSLVYEIPQSSQAFLLQCQSNIDTATVVQWNLSR